MEQLLGPVVFVLLYGGTFGVVMFILAIGLVMTMGLMRIPNLAHGAFAAVGGYCAAALMSRAGMGYLPAIVVAAVLLALIGALAERILYRHLYRMPELDQILVTLGMCFVVVGVLALVWGPNVVSIPMPSYLSQQVQFAGRTFPVYRLFLLVVGLCIIVAFWLLFDRTSLGARLRAAVDNRSMAQATGIHVDRLVMWTFAAGTGLAALGGGLGAVLFPLEPLYPIKYLPIILIIVALTGMGNIKSSIAVAVTIGIVDTTGRYLFPEAGAFTIYLLVLAAIAVRPNGMFAGRRS